MDILSKRIIMTIMSLMLVGITFEAVRRRSLRERYALLWFLAALAVLVSAAFPSVPDFIARKLGITFIEGASYLFVFFLIMVVFHISIVISHLRAAIEAHAQRIALLSTEIERLSRKTTPEAASAEDFREHLHARPK